MLDRDLASLDELETKRLKAQVKRNLDRFPTDFMFELTKEEFHDLSSQFATSSWGGPRYVPMAFTEQGVAMLSSVLRSKRAIQVNVQIMRVFVKLRHVLLDHAELKRELDELRSQTEERFQVVFTVLDKLVNKGEEEKRKIGFIDNGVKKIMISEWNLDQKPFRFKNIIGILFSLSRIFLHYTPRFFYRSSFPCQILRI